MADDSTQLAVSCLQVEQALLGAYLFSPRLTTQPLPDIRPKDLVGARHSIIFSAMVSLAKAGKPHDAVTVMEWIRSAGYGSRDMQVYLGSLDVHAEAWRSVAEYEATIRSYASRRALGRIGHQLEQLALSDPTLHQPEASVSARVASLLKRAQAVAGMNGHHESTITTSTARQLYDRHVAEADWIIKPWLARGEMVVFAGEPGTGKSLISLQICMAIALGRAFINDMPVVSGPLSVLYLDAENSQAQVTRRVRRLTHGMDLGTRDLDAMHLQYADGLSPNLDDPTERQKYLRLVREVKPDVIVMDSLIRFSRVDENSNSEVRALFAEGVRPMALESGAAMIVLHHLSKPGKDRPDSDLLRRIRGAGDILAACDQAWGVERSENGLRMRHLKCRWTNELSAVDLSIEDVQGGEGVLIVGCEEESTSADVTYETIRVSGEFGCPRPAVVSALKNAGLQEPTRLATRNLGRLYQQGKVIKQKEGKIMRYWLRQYAPKTASI